MEIEIRQEKKEDFPAVFDVITQAFEKEEMSDHQEQYLVERLRKSEAFIPQLSLVAVLNGQIIGHILLSKIQIKNDSESFESLALAPVSVLPEFQHKGIGGNLIRKAHEVARDLGFGSVVVLGHADYYPKFGYSKAADFGITLPFEVPSENCLAIELLPNSLDAVTGMVIYPAEFFQS